MTQDEIIEMAREAGCEIRNGHIYNQYTGSLDQMLKRFAKLVAAKAIAELESQYPHGMYAAEDLDKAWKSGYDNCKDQYAYLDKQEPVAWACRVVGGRKWLSIHASKGASDKWLEYRIKEQAQGEQYEQVKLHTHPPQAKP